MAQGRLTRSQVEVVLRRAAELEARQPSDDDEDAAGTGMAEPDLLRLGEEAGLSEGALREALEELRAGKVEARQTTLDRALGERQLIVQRTIPGPSAPVARAVERFLRQQLMTIRRHHGHRIEWQRARGLWPGLVRSLAFARQFAFGPVSRVETMVEEVSEDQTHVTFRIDLAEWRRDRMVRAVGRAVTAFGFFGLGGAWLFPGFGAPDVMALLSGGGLAGGFMALERKRFIEGRDEVAVAPARFLDLLALRRSRAIAGRTRAETRTPRTAAEIEADAELDRELGRDLGED